MRAKQGTNGKSQGGGFAASTSMWVDAKPIAATVRRLNRWFFLYGFAKNERSNVSDGDLKALRELAADLLVLGEPKIRRANAEGLISEVINEQ